MSISPREAFLGLTTLAVALFGGTAVLVKPKVQEWKDLRAAQEQVRRDIAVDQRLVEQRENWKRRFDEVSKALPQHPRDKKMDVHWLSIIDLAAQSHEVQIRRLEAGKEERQGEVYELPIECKDWEGGVDALVHFLFDLQSRGAMLDIRHLLVRPKAGKTLRGRFSLSCAYTREQGGGQAAERPETE